MFGWVCLVGLVVDLLWLFVGWVVLNCVCLCVCAGWMVLLWVIVYCVVLGWVVLVDSGFVGGVVGWLFCVLMVGVFLVCY